MLSRILKSVGLSTPDDVIGFLVCGMTALPTFLFIAGERNAAAVVMLVLFNVLLIFGIRNREHENLEAEAKELEQQIAAIRHDDEPPNPHH